MLDHSLTQYLDFYLINYYLRLICQYILIVAKLCFAVEINLFNNFARRANDIKCLLARGNFNLPEKNRHNKF